jgi:hypothetical protein
MVKLDKPCVNSFSTDSAGNEEVPPAQLERKRESWGPQKRDGLDVPVSRFAPAEASGRETGRQACRHS